MRKPVLAGVGLTLAAALGAGLAVGAGGDLGELGGLGGLGGSSGDAPRSAASPAAPFQAVAPSEPPAVLAAATGRGADTAAVTGALDDLLGASALAGPSALVLDASGAVVFDRAGERPRTPASTAKILTAAAALTVLGPDSRLGTRVMVPAVGRETVWLAGGGDATLDSERLAGLADAAAAELRGSSVALGFDDSAFAGPAVSPDWGPGYVPGGIVAPVHSLSVDGGRVRSGSDERVADPALAAAQEFAALLRSRGVRVRGKVAREPLDEGTTELVRVESARVEDLVEQMLTTSDNDLAEALVRLVARTLRRPTTAAGGGAAVLETVAGLGVPVGGAVLLDGSGLARGSRLPAQTVAQTLLLATQDDHPELRPVLTGLPVAGATGTLEERYARDGAQEAGRGLVRAKTGTLTGVSALAGTTVTRDGRLLVFALLADQVQSTLDARAALDEAATALAECRCG